MRIGWTHPIPPSTPVNKARKAQTTSPSEQTDDFIPSQELRATYSPSSSPPAVQESELQVKNYVMTVVFRQNWVEKKSSSLNTEPKTRGGFDYQDLSYWQPEKVAQRVISFSKSLVSDDPKSIDHLLSSAFKGLDDAEKMLGETEILRQTRESIADAFRAWKSHP